MTLRRPLRIFPFVYYRSTLFILLTSVLAGCGSDSKTEEGEQCSPSACNALPGVSKSHCDGKDCVIDACLTGFHVSGNTCEADAEDACVPAECSAKTGVQTSHCDGKDCVIDVCLTGFHLEGNACIEDEEKQCVPAECSAKTGVQTSHCDGKDCVIDTCKTGFHLANNACEPDDEEPCLPSKCSAKTGVEKSHCDGDRCIIDRCLSGYRLTDNTCVEIVEKVCYPTACNMTPHAARSHCEGDTCVITECEIGYHIFGETCEPDSLENCGQNGTTCEDECFHGQCRDTCEEDGETRCRMIIETNPATGLHNLAVFKKSTCLNTQWQNEQPCPENYICDSEGKDCIDPNDIGWFQTMCGEAEHLLECIQYQGVTYNAFCYTEIESVTACVGDTPNCNWNEGCYDVQACYGDRQLPDGHGGCKCDYGYTYDDHQCYELCDSSGSFGLCVSGLGINEDTYVGFCNDYTFDFIEDCGDMPCRGEDSYYYCTQECAEHDTLCKQIYDAQKNPIYIELSCQNDRYFGGAKLCENGCSEDGKTCRTP